MVSNSTPSGRGSPTPANGSASGGGGGGGGGSSSSAGGAAGSSSISSSGNKAASAKGKVSDVISSFRPCRRFRLDDTKASYTSLDFDNSGELALLACDDETIQIYNCVEGKHAKELRSQKYGVHLARFTHHAQGIIYASTKVDDTIRYLSTHDNSYIRYFRGHTAAVTALSLSPSSDTFLSCSQDNTVKLWDLNSASAQGQLQLNCPYLCAFDPSASVFAVASPLAQAILLYDMRNFDKAPFATFDLQSFESNYVPSGLVGKTWTSLHFGNDGKTVVVGTSGPGHFVLDAFDGALKFFCARPGGASAAPRSMPGKDVTASATTQSSKHATALLGRDRPTPRGQGDICLSPDGRYLIGGSGGQDSLLVWDLHAPERADRYLKPVSELPGHGKSAVVGYNPRHNLIASADRDLLLWLPDLE